MTTKKELVRFAEAMGCVRDDPHPPRYFLPIAGEVRIILKGEAMHRTFNPRTNPADAIELAEKLDIQFSRDTEDRIEKENGLPNYWARPANDAELFYASTLCDAICDAANAYLEEKTEERKCNSLE